MAQASISLARKAALGMAAAAAMVTSASASDFTQDQCKIITGTALGVVKQVGKDTLSTEFKQSLRNWLGPNITCDGPKDIAIITHNDSVTYRTIRSMLLSGSKPLSLEKAGLRAVVKPADVVSAVPPVEKRSDASSNAPSVN